MGTRRSEYVILGVNLKDAEFDEDKFDQFGEISINKFIYLYDGMSGTYCAVGKLLAYGDEFFGHEELFEFDLENSADEIQSVKDFLKENFGIEESPKILVITHWS